MISALSPMATTLIAASSTDSAQTGRPSGRQCRSPFPARLVSTGRLEPSHARALTTAATDAAPAPSTVTSLQELPRDLLHLIRQHIKVRWRAEMPSITTELGVVLRTQLL